MSRYSKTFRTYKFAALTGMSLALLPVHTANAADLQADLNVADTVIRLADIFTDTGPQGEDIIMAAPAPGKKIQLSSYELVWLAKKYKLDWELPVQLKRIYLHRESTAISFENLKEIIRDQTLEQGKNGDLEIKVFGSKKDLYLPIDGSIEDIVVHSFTLNEQQNRFSAILHLPTGTNEPNEIRVSGTIDEVRLVPMFLRVIAPGEIITKADIKWTKYPVKRIKRRAITDVTQILGHTVKRALPAGKLLLESDFQMPVTIAKGSSVLITYRFGALTLSMQGRALEDGGTGDLIRIMNPTSKKTIFAEVISDGYVKVSSLTPLALASR